VGVIPFNVVGTDHYKVAAALSFEGGIAVRNGCFCAHPYILRLLEVSGKEALRHQQDIVNGSRVGLPGLVRISFGCYNTVEEVDHALDVLAQIAAGELEGDYVQDTVSGACWPRGYEPDYNQYFYLRPGLSSHRERPAMPRCGM
jgi:cysteine desulfurase/selenocysteine lyase